ncbi:SusD/RagB family nutrient-binding outer membrane lipoprotein [Bacteroides sp.]|uniref:SusD/RagB family nutrient-binding outer membrane lipoprotein n=1 Tax=Bacteroides sp. TaxID=29523 RepID=UPI002FC66F59
MKTIKKVTHAFGVVSLLCAACSDFDEVNTDPTSATIDQSRVEYALNKSITDAQQNPDVAERSFVLNWKTAARQHLATGIAGGTYNNDWITAYYNQSASWQQSAALAIQLADEKTKKGLVGHDMEMIPNMKEVARIWRAYLMSEFVDNFGSLPKEAFQGENPQFNSAKDIYYFMLDELKDAVKKINPTVKPNDTEKNYDRAYKFDFEKWIRFANSMRMRLAMRLSEVDGVKAKSEFEEAAKGNYIATNTDNFAVAERSGWDALTGVMTREWNAQLLSATLRNLMLGLGGVKTLEVLSDEKYQTNIKPADYIGVRYEKHYSLYTNDPCAGFWLDGLPQINDPRAYALFVVPGDFDNKEFCAYPSWDNTAKTVKRDLLKEDKTTVLETIDATFTWNAPAIGSHGDAGALNKVYTFNGTNPRLALKYRNNTSSRIFFGAWESFFLIAEASVRGWSVPVGAKEAYEKGITASFEYNGVSSFIASYLSSEEYNNVGTSVSWEHTEEPAPTKTMKMKDGYTKETKDFTYKYPVASQTLYGKALNDKLTKIITQKFIANMPWLPMESWSDYRRLGLPFFETPAVEQPLVNIPTLNKDNYMTQTIKFFPQRLKFPADLANSSPEGYKQAVEVLGGPDDVFTPLWWAKKK